ncbi:MAG: EutN/CcmL family microcompartment protein [Ignavibacteriaceae bacterium]|jgi:microcompartment protein CcmK/EutM
MFLARVEKRVISSIKHKAYEGKTVFVVRPIYPDGKAKGKEQIAIDYVGAGAGDIVVCGGAPGVARTVFNLKLAPIKTLIMAIVDKIDYHDI